MWSFFTIALPIEGYLILFEEVRDEFVIVDYLKLAFPFGRVQLPEESIHTLGVELEMPLNFLHPGLVHPVEVSPDDFSDLEVYQGIFLIEINLDYVSYEKKGKLNPLSL